jgi:hypothetical protein
VDAPDVYGSGSQSISWDFALFSSTDADNLVSETSTFPLSSSTALTGTLISHDFSLNDSTDWNTFSLPRAFEPSSYLGNESQLLSGGAMPFTTSGDSLNTMLISTGVGSLHDAHFSTPMVKGKIFVHFYLLCTNAMQIIHHQVHLQTIGLASLLRQSSPLRLITKLPRPVPLLLRFPRSRSGRPTPWLRAAIVRSASTK